MITVLLPESFLGELAPSASTICASLLQSSFRFLFRILIDIALVRYEQYLYQISSPIWVNIVKYYFYIDLSC